MVVGMIGTVGISQRIDTHVHAVEQRRESRRDAIAAEQRIYQAEHQYIARHLVAVDGRGIKELRLRAVGKCGA